MNKIAIIGAGNLGISLVEGLLKSKETYEISITRRNIDNVKHYESLGIHVSNNNKEVVKASKIIILAVKPFQAVELLKEIDGELSDDKILISVVTGLNITEIACYLSKPVTIVRAMPNTAVAIGESMTCIASINATSEQLQYATEIFSILGKTVLIEEKLMNASTVLGACGIAFAMRYIRACIQGGIEIGFDSETARVIAAQTVKGAAEILLQLGKHPEQEIDKVTTPKGCTIAGLNEMEHQGFSSSLIKGICSSFERIS